MFAYTREVVSSVDRLLSPADILALITSGQKQNFFPFRSAVTDDDIFLTKITKRSNVLPNSM